MYTMKAISGYQYVYTCNGIKSAE